MTYDDFWLRYLRAHVRRTTRHLHFCGTLLALACIVAWVALDDWRWLGAAPVVGYGFAWIAHLGIEGNLPETFGHPFWSLASDGRMLALWLTGRLDPHLARSRIASEQPAATRSEQISMGEEPETGRNCDRPGWSD